MRFQDKLHNLLRTRGKTYADLSDECGVCRFTIYKGIKRRTTLAAIAYFLGMTVEEMVEGTEMEEVWQI